MKTIEKRELHNESTIKYNKVHTREEKLLKIGDLIAYLNVSRNYFYTNLIDRIPAVFLDDEKKVRRYDLDSVNEWLHSH